MPSAHLLLLGGSGFVSGTLARAAVAAGHRVTAVTRGQRDLPAGVRAVRVDRRDRPAFAAALAGAGEWDLVVDCIGYEPDDARQDVSVFEHRAGQLVFISTDFVFDPARRRFPQPVEGEYLTDASYGAQKRRCEEVLLAAEVDFAWTIVRPCHIYGPGSQLGCLPEHGRDPHLLDRLRRREPLRLAGGGTYLQQPILAADLAALILSTLGRPGAHGSIFPAAGPEIVESRRYYELLAEELGVPLEVVELPLDAYRAEHPEHASFLCHRIYDLAPLAAAGLAVPATPLAEGLAAQVAVLAG